MSNPQLACTGLAIGTIVFATALAGCGAGEQPGQAAQALRAPAQQSHPVEGTVYVRSDAVAYEPGGAPATGLPGAQVTFAGATATADGAGRFSVAPTFSATRDAVPVEASLFGYMANASPWYPPEAVTSVSVGLYADPASAPAPRPGFVTGIIPHDAGGFMQTVFAEGLHAPTYDRIKAVAGANLVAYSDPAWVVSYDTATNVVGLMAQPANLGGPTRAQYESIVGEAHARGMQFMMMLGIYGDQLLNSGGFGNIPSSNTAFWDALFAAYQPIVIAKATLARDLGIEHLVLGFNQGYMLQGRTENWRQLIAAVRGVGYTGKVSYFAMTSAQGPWTDFGVVPASERNELMGLFDVVGLDIYDGIPKHSPDEVLSPQQTRARMREGLAGVFDLLVGTPSPILVMIGTPSVFGGVTSQDYIEPCLACGSLAPARTRDVWQQADVYQAAMEVIADTPTGAGRVMGVLSWGYHYRDDPTRFNQAGDSAYDKSGSIRGKPAEAVMKAWAQRWAASPPADVARIFDWAQSKYPQYFSGPAQSGYIAPYTYRRYGQTGFYLGESQGRVIVHNGAEFNLQDVGAVADYLPLAAQAGF